jgi:hypothetical protein
MIAIMRAHILAFAAVLGLGLAIVTAIAIAPPALAQEVEPASTVATIGPVVPKANSGPCVRDDHEFMRRNHMDLLKHQRDETMHKGMRGKSADSLKKCVSCHAVKNDAGNFVGIESPKHFCRVCHDYAAVRIDCFQCHASTPDEKKSATADGTGKKSDIAALSKYLREASK